jgi:poly(beta-D-mannuronate) lyase
MTRAPRWLTPAVAGFAAALAAPPALSDSGELGPGLFDVEQRRAELQQPDYAEARDACLAMAVEDVVPLPEPVDGLYPTDGYGTDHGTEDYAWAMMVLSGRSLAGDVTATGLVIDGLISWAEADALENTPTHYDPFFALKRTMLPTMVAYRIVADEMTMEDSALVQAWIDGLVRRLDVEFGGAVDRSNHRYAADLALMAWGSITRDQGLIDNGLERYSIALGQARPDGSLPLETQRGARAMWYTDVALGELTQMAQIADVNGMDLYSRAEDGMGHAAMLGFLLDVLETPGRIFPYAAENVVPGPSDDYRSQDLSFLVTRGQGRHYMAWTEAFLTTGPDTPELRRLGAFFATELAGLRPLIDDWSGGNATCFWMQPDSARPTQ